MINCKQYNSKENCDTEANCRWQKNGCIRRDGVLAGKRYRYINGNLVLGEDPGEALPVILNHLTFDDFEYNPDYDIPKPVLTQKTLFAGSYGITFIPAFPCVSGQRFLNSLGKVFLYSDSASQEWILSKKIQKIEKGTSQKYFTYPKFECDIPFKCPENGYSNLTAPEKDLYDFYKKEVGDKIPKTLIQHVMEYSGSMLDKYFSLKITRAEFLHILENLFYGTKRLNDNGLIHCDLKEENIIISNTKRLRIIDFGLTVTTADFYRSYKNILLTQLYPHVAAPELDAFVRKTDKLPYLSYDEFVKSFDEQITKGAYWYKYFMGDQSQEYTEMISEIDDNGITFLKSTGAALTQDPYSIGLIMMRLIKVLIPEARDNPQSVRQFKDLIKGLLAPNPRDRFTINEAIHYLKLIKSHPHPDPFKTNHLCG